VTCAPRTCAVLLMLILLAWCPGCKDEQSPGPSPINISGTWQGEQYAYSDTVYMTLSLDHDGTTVTGTASFNEIGVGEYSLTVKEGLFSGDELEFMLDIRDIDPEDNEQLYYNGILSAAKDTIAGEVIDVHDGTQEDPAPWWVAKQ